MILCVTLGTQEGLLGKNTKWYKERWNKGTAIKADECRLCWTSVKRNQQNNQI